MKRLFVLVLLILSACGNEDQHSGQIDIQQLNGYWEIVQAQNPYGKSVIYSINSTVDYIELKDSLGFRKKLSQTIGGKMKTSQDLEKFKVIVENDTVKLAYNTLYSNWKEAVLRLNDSLLLIKNDKDFLYTYKRFEPVSN